MKNINIGILGHVDSGKTSLARALSTQASTAAFDKNPQSKERGITIDLGFSTFSMLIDSIDCQLTLVDCPGHASLIRTVIGGAQIIDLCLLVVDAQKGSDFQGLCKFAGFQTQTAECLIVAEITSPAHLIVVVNKMDLIDEGEREKTRTKLEKRIRKTLEETVFKTCQIVYISAQVGGGDVNSSSTNESSTMNLSDLMDAIRTELTGYTVSKETPGKSFVMAVDHCFAIKGKGQVVTGTVLSGSISINDPLYFSTLADTRKVKSIQSFRTAVDKCSRGDRAGICVAQFGNAKFERGLVCSPGGCQTVYGAIVSYNRVRFFKPSVANKSRFHVTIGHETVMARCRLMASTSSPPPSIGVAFDPSAEYESFDEQTVEDAKSRDPDRRLYAVLEFETPVICPMFDPKTQLVEEAPLFIASRLDALVHTTSCRLAFHGRLLVPFSTADYRTTYLPALHCVKYKSRAGTVDRQLDEQTLIVQGIMKKDSDITVFQNCKVSIQPTGETGLIEGTFGKSGKIRVRLTSDLTTAAVENLEARAKKDGSKSTHPPLKVVMEYKKRMFQGGNKQTGKTKIIQ